MLASGLIDLGLSWQMALVWLLVGNFFCLLVILLNGHAGPKYGVPFPVALRSSFGHKGALATSMLRAFVGAGWFGIEGALGSDAFYRATVVIMPFLSKSPYLGDWLALNLWQLVCVLFFWSASVFFAFYGADLLKKFEKQCAILLTCSALGLFVWAWASVGSLGDTLAASSVLATHEAAALTPRAYMRMLCAVTVRWHFTAELADRPPLPLDQCFFACCHVCSVVVLWQGYWSCIASNVADYTRYVKSNRDQVIGQTLGMFPGTVLFSFIGVFVTCAGFIVFGAVLWNPIDLVSRFDSPVVVVLVFLLIFLATLSTNVAANVIPPINGMLPLSQAHQTWCLIAPLH